MKAVEILRDCFDDPAITTDIITGFPGETEEEFRNTLDFVERVGFYETHVFKYSYKNGLETKVNDKYESTGSHAYSSNSTRATVNYKGNNITKLKSYGTTYKVKSSNGHVQSASYTDKWSNGSGKYSSNFTWNGDQCTKMTGTRTSKYKGQKAQTSTNTTTYSNFKKGVPTKVQSSYKGSDGSSSTYAPYKYTLDSKGNVKKVKYGTNNAVSFKLKYSNGRVVKKTNGSTTYTLKYKKVTVNAPSIVKAQQWSLINNNNNCAFGPVSLGV